MIDRWVSAFCYFLCRAFPGRSRVVPHAEDPDTDLLLQFMIVPGWYLQHFITPESYAWYHRHRWGRMRSWVVSGWFVEDRPCAGGWITHDRWTSYTMTRATIHHVVYWSRHCWTLFWHRDATDDWGYYPRGRYGVDDFVPWREHIRKRVRNLETGVINA